jgi:NAD(P)-dependent dehydrogenase (short-subunit alcohol dehydrogenase family)
MTWTTSNMPSQHGRTAVITGTGGLGLEDALALARAGADVIIAGRNAQKGAEAVARVTTEVPNAKVRFEQVDLASLASVETFAKRLSGQLGSLDLLINNAAVMTPPKREQTSDGFELQLGTNYLGHVALTARLMPLLKKGKDPRVVMLSSVAAREGKLDFDDLQSERSYASMTAYGQSKLACLMFGRELHRQSVANGWGVTSLVAHPGVSRTDLLHNAPGKWSAAGMARTFLWFLFQPPAQGALPTLYAATSPEAKGGGYYGPHALSETRGYPTAAKVPPQAEDQAAAERLWRVSLELARVSF